MKKPPSGGSVDALSTVYVFLLHFGVPVVLRYA